MSNHYRLLSLLLLSGCQANQDSLTDYVAQVERQAQRHVATLAPMVKYEVVHYAQRQGRGPFTLPQEALVQDQPLVKTDCWQPELRRKNGVLERYPLAQLRFKGVMSRSGSVSGLVQTPQGSLLSVNAGQYLGLNHGRIIRIADDHLLIKETLPDGLGCWKQRNVKLALK